jgi:hypothetical protein
MKIKRKPDFLFILAVLVGIGVLVTMRAQSGSVAQATPHVSVAATNSAAK